MKKSDFKAFQSNYLAKSDLQGGPLQLIVKSVDPEDVQGEGGKEEKAVMSFRGHDQTLILNSTNWDTLEEAFGSDSDDWSGKRIEVYFDPSVQFGGKKVGGVRVRPIQTADRQAASGEA